MKQEWIDKALVTWYPKDHPLHLDLTPSLMGLAGEAGELIDLHKKVLYKDGYECDEAKILSELGDLWYYLRIVIYQLDNVDYVQKNIRLYRKPGMPLTLRCVEMSYLASSLLRDHLYLSTSSFPRHYIVRIYKELIDYCETAENITLDELTELNWQKLNPDNGNSNGWQTTLENTTQE